MDLKIIEVNGQKIAEVISDEIVIKDPQDALDIMAAADYEGARAIMIYEKNIIPDFFELRTKIAGEILLKFSNYRVKLAIIGEFEKFKSKSLQAFIRESNRGKQVFFTADRESAAAILSG